VHAVGAERKRGNFDQGISGEDGKENVTLKQRTHLERITVGYVVSTTLAIVLVHGVASLLRAAFTDQGPVGALELSCATIIIGLLSAIVFALILCPIVVRVAGSAFAMLHLAFGQLMYILALKLRNITGIHEFTLRMTELDLDFVCRNVPSENSPKATLLKKLGGEYQVPFLVDSDNNVAMYESDDIIKYLEENYSS